MNESEKQKRGGERRERRKRGIHRQTDRLTDRNGQGKKENKDRVSRCVSG